MASEEHGEVRRRHAAGCLAPHIGAAQESASSTGKREARSVIIYSPEMLKSAATHHRPMGPVNGLLSLKVSGSPKDTICTAGRWSSPTRRSISYLRPTRVISRKSPGRLARAESTSVSLGSGKEEKRVALDHSSLTHDSRDFCFTRDQRQLSGCF